MESVIVRKLTVKGLTNNGVPPPIKEPPAPERRFPPSTPPDKSPSKPPIDEPPLPRDPDQPPVPPIGDPEIRPLGMDYTAALGWRPLHLDLLHRLAMPNCW